MKTFTYFSDGLKAYKSTIKGVEKYFVEGYCSTTKRDLAGEILTDSAQDSMTKQFKDRVITVDIEHSSWFKNGKRLEKPETSLIPVAKVVEAVRKEKGTWVKSEMNTNLENFNEIWGSVKDKFLTAYSVAFFPTKQFNNQIDDLNIINLTLTGTPVNDEATFEPVMKSARAYLKGDIMKEGNEVKETKEEKTNIPVTNEPVETNTKPAEVEIKETEKTEEEPKKTEEPEKTEPEKEVKESEIKETDKTVTFKLSELIPEITKMVSAELDKQKTEPETKETKENITVNPLSIIKARKVEMFNTPIFKSKFEKTKVVGVSPLGLIK